MPAASFRENIPNQQALACSSDCSACCHLYVQVPPGTAATIADHIATTFTPAERDALHARLTQAAAAVSHCRSHPTAAALSIARI